MSIASEVVRIALKKQHCKRKHYEARTEDGVLYFEHWGTVILKVQLSGPRVVGWGGYSVSDRQALTDVIPVVEKACGREVTPIGLRFRRENNILVAETGGPPEVYNPDYIQMYSGWGSNRIKNLAYPGRKGNPVMILNPNSKRFNERMEQVDTLDSLAKDKLNRKAINDAVHVFTDRIKEGRLSIGSGECWELIMFGQSEATPLNRCRKCDLFGGSECGGGATFLYRVLEERGYGVPEVWLGFSGPDIKHMQENLEPIRLVLHWFFKKNLIALKSSMLARRYSSITGTYIRKLDIA